MHNYILKMMAMIDRGEIDGKKCANLHFAHDDWCGIFSGQFCDCDPDITYYPADNMDEWKAMFMALHGLTKPS